MWGGGQGEGPAHGDRAGLAGRWDAGDTSVAQKDLRKAGFSIEVTSLLDPDHKTPGGVVVARRPYIDES